MIFKNDKIYKVLKWLALGGIMLFGKTYKNIAAVWGWPLGEAVQETCLYLSIFVGGLIGISSERYANLQKGECLKGEGSE